MLKKNNRTGKANNLTDHVKKLSKDQKLKENNERNVRKTR